VILVAATFVLCLAIVLGAYWVFVVRVEDSAVRALRRRIQSQPPVPRRRADLMKKEMPLSAVKALDEALARFGSLLNPLKQTLTNAALPVTVGVVLLACVFAGATMFWIARLGGSSAWLAAVVGAVFSPAPYLYVRRKARLRIAEYEAQLPQAVEMLAVSLRAGHAFTTGLLMASEELSDPLGTEFRYVYDQQNYGKALPDVLKEFAERVPLLDARIFVTAVLTQRETGGNLAEILDRLASVIRERFRVRRQVRSMSAHGRITGWVLGLLPAVLAAVLFVVAPAHMQVLVDDPLGRQLIMLALVLQIIGAFAIRRIVNIEF
jgi:tight adherence protein B